MAKRTPLFEVHMALGASFTEFVGWDMPLRYRSEVLEHRAVRDCAGLFDLTHMGEVAVTGPGAGAALDYALVGRPSAVPVGRARYSMICTDSGGVLDDLIVYHISREQFFIVANASNVQVVYGELVARSRDFAATVTDETAAWALVAVQGPASASVLTAVSNLDVNTLKYYSVANGFVDSAMVRVARTGYTGEDGFEIFCKFSDAVHVWQALMHAGAAWGIVPAGLAARDSLRLEAGMPLYGQELTEHTTPFDVGLGRVVAFGKPGGFVGETALLAARDGGPTRALIGLRSDGHRSPRNGHDVVAPESGSVIGTVTSGCPSPTLGYPIAMALVNMPDIEPGTHLQVLVRGQLEDVTVTTLPFYSRKGDRSC